MASRWVQSLCRAHDRDRPIDRPSYSVCNNRPRLRNTVMRPIIITLPVQVWASENVPVGTVILRLKARDRDIGRNARIVYEFSQHTAEQYGHLFGIKADSGKIYIKNNLDFEVRLQPVICCVDNERRIRVSEYS